MWHLYQGSLYVHAPSEEGDLAEADWAEGDLAEADWAEADLAEADLAEADLAVVDWPAKPGTAVRPHKIHRQSSIHTSVISTFEGGYHTTGGGGFGGGGLACTHDSVISRCFGFSKTGDEQKGGPSHRGRRRGRTGRRRTGLQQSRKL